MAVNRHWKYVRSAGDNRTWLFDRTHDPRETRDLSAEPAAAAAREAMKQDLLGYLRRSGMEDAWIETAGTLDWRPHPPIDEDYLRDPDARLLFQDYPSYPLALPGYSE